MQAWLDSLIAGSELLQQVPAGLIYTIGILGACTLVLLFASLLAGEVVWLERRVAGRMQARIGPNRVGPQGLLQFLADGLKLLGKEDIIPATADKAVFLMAPVIVFMGAFAAYCVMPFGYGLVPADMNLGLFLILSITSIEVVGVIMAGWASNSKWSILGAMREVAQMVSYEIPLGIAALSVAILAGTLNLTDITLQQGGGIWNWYVFRGPFGFIGFFAFFIAALASLKRAPFDLPEAESELVAGFHTEYTGFRFAIFFLAEYAGMILFAMLTSVLFLGGWYTGIPGIELDGAGSRWIGFGVLFAKTSFLLFVMIWVRWSLPRFRIDRVMYLCYKVLLPISVLCVVGAAAQVWLGITLAGGTLAAPGEGGFADWLAGGRP
ncbi:MAG: NADH-quinone oxidoreductase subunit NuoH [Planctomycetota bacterium]|nr:NADH-quinone oxidoreductase subunit NuoH [Planctomycetota bacterium]